MEVSKFEKIGLILSAFIIVVLVFLILFSERGVMDYKALKKKEAIVNKQTHAVDAKNRKLESEIRRLKDDSEYIKHVAKHVHDMAEDDELIFKNKEDTKRSRP